MVLVFATVAEPRTLPRAPFTAGTTVRADGAPAPLAVATPMVTGALALGPGDGKVTVSVLMLPVRVDPVAVAMLQLMERVDALTLIPAANIGLEKVTSASRGRIALDLSILGCKLGCKSFIASFFFVSTANLPRATVLWSLSFVSASEAEKSRAFLP
jgi:hypothetical protein